MSQPASSRNRPIALVGLSGSGKSSVGRRLAAWLRRPLVDTDALVAQAAGRSIPAIFAHEGEARFRDREAAALEQALAGPLMVVATGGGIVLRAENRALLRQRAYVVWLDAPTGALVERLLAHHEDRPLLHGGDPTERLEALRAARASLYAEVADLRIETGGRELDDICEEIVRGAGGL